MKLAAIISGGKDSIYAAYLASKENDIEYLISIVSDGFFSEPNSHIVRQQAAMMGIPLLEKHSKDDEFGALEEILGAIRDEVDGIVFGSVASNNKKMEIDALCKRLGLLPIAPLWHLDAKDYMTDMINSGFNVLFVSATYPLTKDWLGRKLDAESINELVKLNKKHGINVAGEGGEYDTFVLDCPLFIRKIDVQWAESQWDGKKGVYEIKKIGLAGKD